jgi:hypothetical protein
MSQSISVSDRPRCNRHILVMSPEPNGSKHRIFHLMQSGDELHAIVIRNSEILTQDAADGVNWLDGQRHLLQEFDAINRHTIALSGDLIHSTVE